MSFSSPILTPHQEQELADFLVALNDSYLSLDLSRQALHDHFRYVRDETHADSILHQFRDRHILSWVEVSPMRWRWLRSDEAEALEQSKNQDPKAKILEPRPELQLKLMPGPAESLPSLDFQKELQDFAKALRAEGIEVRSRWFTQDAVGASGWGTGEFSLVAVLGSTAIVQIRKLIIDILKRRAGRKLKLKFGSFSIEGDADDIERLLTPEQIAKMLEQSREASKKVARK